jgi:hypothetical protein
MHPTLIMAVAREVERERRHDGHEFQLRSLNRARGRVVSPAAGGFARRLLAGISLRPSLS